MSSIASGIAAAFLFDVEGFLRDWLAASPDNTVKKAAAVLGVSPTRVATLVNGPTVKARYALRVNPLAAQNRRADHAVKFPPCIRGCTRMPVVQLVRVDDKRFLGCNHTEVSVVSGGDLALACQPREPCGTRRHPYRDLLKADAAGTRLGPDQRQAELQ